MKDSYGFYLFDKSKEVFVENEEKTNLTLSTQSRQSIFKDITGVDNYYGDNLHLEDDKKEILDSKVGFFDKFKSEELQDFNYKEFIEKLDLVKNTSDPETKMESHNFYYFYYKLYSDIKSKIEDGIFDINKASKFLNEIPQIFLSRFNAKEPLEVTYYSLNGKISSNLDNKYLLFRKNEQKFIRDFLVEVVKTKDLLPEDIRKFRGAAEYLLETLNVNIGDLVLENIFNKKDRTKTDKDFYLYQIIRIYINNARFLNNDSLMNSLHKASLIDEKIDNHLFFKKTNGLLKNIKNLVKEISLLKDMNVKDKDEFNERSSIVKQSINLFNKTISEIEFTYNDFGEANYKKIKKDINKLLTENGFESQETLLECFENVFRKQFLSEVDLENRKEFIVSL